MNDKNIMTAEEIHEFGVDIIKDYLLSQGFTDIVEQRTLGENPQFTARHNDHFCHVIVRTAVYPLKGILEDESEFLYLLNEADKQKAICYFASVGIANAEGKTPEEMSIPLRDAGFYVSFDGLGVMTTNNRVKLLGED